MLQIEIPGAEYYDQSKNEFVYVKNKTISLEHSLCAISKWESKWKKPFLNTQKTSEETFDYFRCMCEEELDDETYDLLCLQARKIDAYIGDPMTATTFSDAKSKGKSKKITSEEIYYLMIEFGIPFSCDKWNFNRLMTLLHICSIRKGPKKKMSVGEVMRWQTELNDRRRKALGSKG